MNYVYLACAILLEIIATSMLKASDGFTRLVPSVITIAGYGGTFYLLSLTLKTIPTGIAYAIWSGCGIVLISIVSCIVYGQKLDMPAIGGMTLIVAGVAVINIFSRVSGH